MKKAIQLMKFGNVVDLITFRRVVSQRHMLMWKDQVQIASSIVLSGE